MFISISHWSFYEISPKYLFFIMNLPQNQWTLLKRVKNKRCTNLFHNKRIYLCKLHSSIKKDFTWSKQVIIVAIIAAIFEKSHSKWYYLDFQIHSFCCSCCCHNSLADPFSSLPHRNILYGNRGFASNEMNKKPSLL